MRVAPIAPLPELANAQHYEVPAAFFAAVLGPQRKYSCCHWPEGVDDLAEAEASALALTCERAELADRQDILELGCGWGSLSLWMAGRYPGRASPPYPIRLAAGIHPGARRRAGAGQPAVITAT